MSRRTRHTRHGRKSTWKPSAEDEALLEEVLQEFIRRGEIERCGKARNGKTLYRGTEFFRTAKNLADEGDEDAATFIELSRGVNQAEILRRGDALSARLGIPWTPVRTPWPQR